MLYFGSDLALLLLFILPLISLCAFIRYVVEYSDYFDYPRVHYCTFPISEGKSTESLSTFPFNHIFWPSCASWRHRLNFSYIHEQSTKQNRPHSERRSILAGIVRPDLGEQSVWVNRLSREAIWRRRRGLV